MGLFVVNVNPSFDEDDEEVETKVFSLLTTSFLSSSCSSTFKGSMMIGDFSIKSKLSVELISIGSIESSELLNELQLSISINFLTSRSSCSQLCDERSDESDVLRKALGITNFVGALIDVLIGISISLLCSGFKITCGDDVSLLNIVSGWAATGDTRNFLEGSDTVTTRNRGFDGKNVGLPLLEDGEGDVEEVNLLLTPLELSLTRETEKRLRDGLGRGEDTGEETGLGEWRRADADAAFFIGSSNVL